MSSIYDVERLLSDIQSLYSSNLNTKIGAINTEKNDSISLKTVDSNAYFTDLNGKQVNYNPFVLYSIENITAKSQNGMTIKDVLVSVVLVVEDQGEDVSIYNRMLRYGRALEEVAQDSFTLIENAVKLEVHALPPVYFQAVNSTEFYRAVGVQIAASLG